MVAWIRPQTPLDQLALTCPAVKKERWDIPGEAGDAAEPIDVFVQLVDQFFLVGIMQARVVAVALHVLLDKPAAYRLVWQSAVVKVVASPFGKVVRQVERCWRGSGILVVDEADQFSVWLLLSSSLRVHNDIRAQQVAVRKHKLQH